MPDQLPELRVVILIPLLQPRLRIGDSLVLLSLYQIDIGHIIGNHLLIGGIVLYHFEGFQRIIVLLLVKTDEPVVIIGIDIVGVLWQLPDGIEQRQGIIKLLEREVAIPLMELEVGDLPVT